LKKIVVGALAAVGVMSQEPPKCWQQPSYQIGDIGLIQEIVYGQSTDPATGEIVDLTLDAYLPPKSDQREKRPLFVYVHGGGFFAGQKDMMHVREFMGEVVSRGFVGVSVGYRLNGMKYAMEPDAPTLETML